MIPQWTGRVGIDSDFFNNLKYLNFDVSLVYRKFEASLKKSRFL